MTDPILKRWPLVREVCLFFGGFTGVFYEAVFQHVDRPELLVVFAGMMGLPAFIRRDEKKRNGDGNGRKGGQ